MRFFFLLALQLALGDAGAGRALAHEVEDCEALLDVALLQELLERETSAAGELHVRCDETRVNVAWRFPSGEVEGLGVLDLSDVRAGKERYLALIIHERLIAGVAPVETGDGTLEEQSEVPRDAGEAEQVPASEEADPRDASEGENENDAGDALNDERADRVLELGPSAGFRVFGLGGRSISAGTYGLTMAYRLRRLEITASAQGLHGFVREVWVHGVLLRAGVRVRSAGRFSFLAGAHLEAGWTGLVGSPDQPRIGRSLASYWLSPLLDVGISVRGENLVFRAFAEVGVGLPGLSGLSDEGETLVETRGLWLGVRLSLGFFA